MSITHEFYNATVADAMDNEYLQCKDSIWVQHVMRLVLLYSSAALSLLNGATYYGLRKRLLLRTNSRRVYHRRLAYFCIFAGAILVIAGMLFLNAFVAPCGRNNFRPSDCRCRGFDMGYFIFGLAALSLGVVWWGQHFRHRAYENAYKVRAAMPRDTGTDLADTDVPDTATDPEPENHGMEQITEEEEGSSSSSSYEDGGFSRAFVV
ncbi:expressed unknown protein [Seminavis robusta]|uniref:Transmembrane protein n=1 Tax=Seminavis robusta TaxID=568900 RepID=A0A9N8D6S8_9STRA|nr:expressed unknown protein [Seminavis robusta]|eukprot:Sro21_g014540.1 n/a (207) ;mRNA; f:33272-33892